MRLLRGQIRQLIGSLDGLDLSIDGMDIPLAILNTFHSLDFFAESIVLLLSLLQL